MRNSHSTECLDVHNGFLETGDFYGFISKSFSSFMDLFQNRFPSSGLSGFLTQDFKRLVSSCGFSRGIFIKNYSFEFLWGDEVSVSLCSK